MITLTEHDRAEFSRCAIALKNAGRIAAGDLMREAATFVRVSDALYDARSTIYRNWLCFNEGPAIAENEWPYCGKIPPAKIS